MGKIVEKKKKKGRPSLLDIQKRTLREQQNKQTNPNPNPNSNPYSNSYLKNPNSDLSHRFTRRNPKPDGIAELPEKISAGEEDEQKEDDLNRRRREKNLKFVLRLPSQKQNQRSLVNSASLNSGSNGSDSNVEGEIGETLFKKQKINTVGGRSVLGDGEKEKKHNSASKPIDTPWGIQMESGPTSPLPDKKLLVFILDRLQKKDTYGVFSEPVDPKELPDYHEIVEHPMDFGTVRNKLSSSAYANLEQFEEDVFLICSNAMRYNAPDTIYFRQARSIQELAKKNFENLRQESDDNEPQPKIVRRGRPPTKNLKMHLGRPPLERNGFEFSSENTNGSNSYDLRRGPLSDRFCPADASRTYDGSRNSEAYTSWLVDHKSEGNDEFPASILKGMTMKFGKKHFVVDENRRNTYKQSHSLAGGHLPSVLATFDGEKKQLMAVGLHMEHGFARSLARFAATLGPVAWKIASKKIERALPAGVKFGPGWVGEKEAPLSQPSLLIPSSAHLPFSQQHFSLPKISSSSTAPTTVDPKNDKSERQEEPSNNDSVVHLNRTSSPSTVVSSAVGNISTVLTTECGEITKGVKSESGFSSSRTSNPGVSPNSPFQIHQEPVLNSAPNGFSGGFRLNHTSQMGKLVRPSVPVGDMISEASTPSDMLDSVIRSNNNVVESMSTNHMELEDRKLSWCPSTINSGTSFVNPSREALVGPRPQPSWRGPSHHQKSDSVPPDLNVRFQSPGSPSSTSQPDLALQL